MRIRRISFFILLCCLCWNVFAAEYQIKGVVIDKSTRQPLEFVNVLVVGLGIGASTDANGNFLITQVPPGIYRLQASFLGYKTELTPEYRVNHVTPYVQIELEEENASLNEVVVTASPFQKVPESPVSLRVIGLQEIEKAPGANRDISKLYKIIRE